MSPLLDNTDKYFWIKYSVLLTIASIIGIATGFAAIAFQHMIEFFHSLFFIKGGELLADTAGDYYVILLPALGALLVSLLVHFFAAETRGEGVPEVIAAVEEKDGFLKPRLIMDKSISSSIIMGSGGSAGREGPIIQIGAAIGSAVGQVLRMPPDMMRTLLACGAAGGISAAFNAPIGGVLFAQELVLGKFATNNFILIVISSISSSIISRIFLGDFPAFVVPAYELVSPGEMFFYLILGVLSGLFSVIYIKVLYKTGDIFSSITRIPSLLKPAAGGLLVGGIGFFFPQIFGVGYDTIECVLSNGIPWMLVFLLLFAKLIATSLTLGSGSPGGDFAPGLYMGAMLGGSFGFLVNALFPDITAPAGAYALVGMGGVLAGQYQAPVTAIIILFEMTGDYKVVLPLMLVCVISSLVARGCYTETIYTEKLMRKGLHIRQGKDVDKMASMLVESVMTTDVLTLDGDTTVDKAKTIMLDSTHIGFPVMYQEELIGMITYEEVLQAIRRGYSQRHLMEVVDQYPLIVVYPRDSIGSVMDKMAKSDIGRLPVVDPDDRTRLIGIISRRDIIDAYSLAANNERS